MKVRVAMACKGAEGQSLYYIRVDESQNGYFTIEEVEAVAKQLEALPELVEALEALLQPSPTPVGRRAARQKAKAALALAGKP